MRLGDGTAVGGLFLPPTTSPSAPAGGMAVSSSAAAGGMAASSPTPASSSAAENPATAATASAEHPARTISSIRDLLAPPPHPSSARALAPPPHPADLPVASWAEWVAEKIRAGLRYTVRMGSIELIRGEESDR